MKSQRQRIPVIGILGRSLIQRSALSAERRTWLRGRLMVTMIAALLLTSFPFASLAHAARLQRSQDAFKVILTTSHFGLQFLHVAADNLKDPNGATFSVTNGATLWYGMNVKTTAGVSHPTAADPVGDPVTDFLGAAELLPPSDIIPINLDGSVFETIKLREAFTAPGQQATITLTPFSSNALTLDALNILLSLVGMQSSTTFGLLQGALGQVLQLVKQVGALIKFISDLNHLLTAVPNIGVALFAANACVDDLIQLFSNKDEVKILGHIFVLMLGSVASDEVVSAIEGFASAIIGIIEAARLGKYLLDFGLSLGSFLFQGGVFPTVTLQSIPANAPVPTPTPKLPTGTIAEFAVPNPGGGPDSLAVGRDGNLWFTESNVSKIGRISPSGSVTEFATPTPISGPGSMVVGPDGALWFTEVSAIGRITLSG